MHTKLSIKFYQLILMPKKDQIYTAMHNQRRKIHHMNHKCDQNAPCFITCRITFVILLFIKVARLIWLTR